MNERIFGIFSLIIACSYIYVASLTQLSFISDPVGPKIFPYMIGFFFIISSIFLIIKPELNPKWPSLYRFLEIVFITIVLIVSFTIYFLFHIVLGLSLAEGIWGF